MARNYVVHFCKNKDCNNAWMDIDLHNAKTVPPSWKYCRECCKKMGIDFDNQKMEINEESIKNLKKGK